MKRTAPARVVKLGLIQSACTTDPAQNLKKTLALVEQAARQGAQIICTQELFRSQYFCRARTTPISNSPSPSPGRAPRRLPSWPASTRW